MPKAEDGKRKHHIYNFIPEESFEHARAARAELRKGVAALFPPELVASRRAAKKEMLLAAREFINHAIDRIEGIEKA